ncbi:IS3 family transposase [Candidatus Phytoplasma solani]|uniref:IS3 family transposase n=1 Tax=Candidatus Phytoplasma solani TaxID=69896 RepID=UPI0032DA00E5
MKYLTENQVKNIIHKYMHYYNYKRKMKILNYLSPIEYKKNILNNCRSIFEWLFFLIFFKFFQKKV